MEADANNSALSRNYYSALGGVDFRTKPVEKLYESLEITTPRLAEWIHVKSSIIYCCNASRNYYSALGGVD